MHKIQGCGTFLKNPRQRKSHKMAASIAARPLPNKPVHSCTFCGLLLSSANALMEHKRIHTGDRPFSCHICNKKFTQKAHLNIHKRTHTGEKPYACHICNKQFAQSSHLNSHKRIHTGEKPFVCGICHVGFTQKQRLDTHLKKHLEKPGQEIVVRQRLMSRTNHVDKYRQTPPVPDNVEIRQITGQGVSHLTSECDMSSVDRNDIVQTRSNGQSGSGSPTVVKQELFEDSNDENGGEKNISDSEKSPKISPRSFSSEGLFVHPSGYVAYGGTTDVGCGSPGDEIIDDSFEPNGKHGASQQSLNSASHRRKPSVVRKRCNESPARDSSARGSSTAELQKLSLAENEMSETGIEKKEINGCQSSCIPLDVENSKAAVSLSVSTRSCSRKNVSPDNVKSLLCVPNTGINSHHGAANEQMHSESSFVRVNNRISLVNFTAEELVAHMMKRDDVHKCHFCCLIFQDAAMYHIHRNMHDKSDIRMCNMCGKLLQDKYDFTAHFLSTHQN